MFKSIHPVLLPRVEQEITTRTDIYGNFNLSLIQVNRLIF